MEFMQERRECIRGRLKTFMSENRIEADERYLGGIVDGVGMELDIGREGGGGGQRQIKADQETIPRLIFHSLPRPPPHWILNTKTSLHNPTLTLRKQTNPNALHLETKHTHDAMDPSCHFVFLPPSTTTKREPSSTSLDLLCLPKFPSYVPH
uniref:Uncharacterized protein n=1 Tax=Compsopogon caeruleus TaxID=31354 RepID=A0A7S1TH68_9RHOD|mmetsp:Transcript_7407/g.15118  ORF Transcript_7407/g.15118 Transcript_7407/m.15118 type:complete len:152 (+) Transcript_7407:1-456(+)